MNENNSRGLRTFQECRSCTFQECRSSRRIAEGRSVGMLDSTHSLPTCILMALGARVRCACVFPEVRMLILTSLTSRIVAAADGLRCTRASDERVTVCRKGSCVIRWYVFLILASV